MLELFTDKKTARFKGGGGGNSNMSEEDVVQPSNVVNWVLNNLIADRRLRPTRVQAQDISEQLHLAASLAPSLPYFLSLYLHSLPHLGGGGDDDKGAESLWHISIATVSRPFKNTCSPTEAAAMLIRDLCLCKCSPLHVESDTPPPHI